MRQMRHIQEMRSTNTQSSNGYGGTFTDLVALDGNGKLITLKAPTPPNLKMVFKC